MWRHLPIGVVSTWALVAVLAPLLSPDANDVQLARILVAPDFNEWFGFDELGRPVLDRMIQGARTSFAVALMVITLSFVIGTVVGMCSAWLGGIWDHVIVRVIDIFLAFPGILLAIALAGILGPGIDNVIVALSAVGWVGFARLARAQSLSVKQREHVLAATAMGARDVRVLWYHIFPYILAPLVVEASFGVAGVVIAEAGLSFLGLGVQPPAASWGTVLREGTRYMLVAPHLVLGPASLLLLVVLSVNLLGDRLRDHLDVRRRWRRRNV